MRPLGDGSYSLSVPKPGGKRGSGAVCSSRPSRKRASRTTRNSLPVSSILHAARFSLANTYTNPRRNVADGKAVSARI